jgi:phenylacetate-CoA ligase
MLKTPLDGWIAGKIGVSPVTLTREAIECYQLAQLRKTVALVKDKSAFYRSKLAGIDPDGIVSFTRFAELPFTSPEDIRNNPYGLVCTPQTDIERVVSLQSSGTTGDPKRIFFTKEDQELTIDFFDYGMRNLIGPSDRIMILLPWELPGSVGDLLKMGLIKMDAHPIPYGPVYNTAEIGRAHV